MGEIKPYVVSTSGKLHHPVTPGSGVAICHRARRGVPVLVADIDVDRRNVCRVCFPAMWGDLL